MLWKSTFLHKRNVFKFVKCEGSLREQNWANCPWPFSHTSSKCKSVFTPSMSAYFSSIIMVQSLEHVQLIEKQIASFAFSPSAWFCFRNPRLLCTLRSGWVTEICIHIEHINMWKASKNCGKNHFNLTKKETSHFLGGMKTLHHALNREAWLSNRDGLFSSFYYTYD